jgi:hypothetical protein
MIACLNISHHQAQPVAAMSERNTNGSQSSLIEKMRMSRMPVKKVGSEKPTKASVLAMRSNHEYGLTAEMMPTGSATARARSCDMPITAKVTGTRCMISVSTSTRLMNEKPQSPCTIATSQRR